MASYELTYVDVPICFTHMMLSKLSQYGVELKDHITS